MDDSIEPPAGKKEPEAYEKIKVLGEGSMGKAYLVRSAADQNLYVMKRINLGHLEEAEKEKARKEAQLHSMVSHAHIIAFKEVYHTTGEKLCLIMEYAEGGDLDQLIKSQAGKQIPEDTVLNYFTQLCLGLRHIHQMNIVHRDLKGANIFIKDGVLKIGDFGISKMMEHTMHATSALVGTPYYLSPEIVEGKPYSQKADVWALGVLLYNLCTQKLPFEANSLPLLALKILRGTFPPITSNAYSRDLKTLILALLQVDQRKRLTVDQILTKPILAKYLPLNFSRQTTKPSAPTNRPPPPPKKQNNTKSRTNIKPDKQPPSEPQDPQQQSRQRRQKRHEQHKEMLEDIRRKVLNTLILQKKQALLQKQQFPSEMLEVSAVSLKPKRETQPDILKAYDSSRPDKNKNSLHKIPSHEKTFSHQKTKALETSSIQQKPWKRPRQNGNKSVEFELVLESSRPKPKQPVKPFKDFPVLIYQPTNKQRGSPIHEQTLKMKGIDQEPETQETPVKSTRQPMSQTLRVPTFEMPPHEGQSSQQDGNYEPSDGDDESIEEAISRDDLSDIMQQVKQIGATVDGLNFATARPIELYEDSETFDTFTTEIKSPPKKRMRFVADPNNLEQLRQILGDHLGQQNFCSAYQIIQKHFESVAANMVRGDSKDSQSRELVSEEDYLFNRAKLRSQMSFIDDQQFSENIDLLYTLALLEDMELRRNLEEPSSIE